MEGTIGEIRMWGGNRSPRGWAFCEGQLLAISSNSSLFSIIGDEYGGDGRTTFALPDFRGRVPIGVGDGPGLSLRELGHRGGAEHVTLTTNEMPTHSHTLAASDASPDAAVPVNAHLAGALIYGNEPTALISMGSNSISNVGGNNAHQNMQPWLGINFVICIFGEYPSFA